MPAIGYGTPEEDVAAIEQLERRQREKAEQAREPEKEPDPDERPKTVPHRWMRSALGRNN